MADRVDRTERLLNLVIALMASPRAVSRSVIREQVPGYADAASDAAFERMFERDKDELRSMGIPVETVSDEFGDVQGYRIPREEYGLAELDLTLDERTALAVAGQVWSGVGLAPVAGTAVRKLESLADGSLVAGRADDITLTVSDAAVIPIMQAMRQNRAVSFDYRAPSTDQAERRTLSPWRLVAAGGHWRVTGLDHDRNAERTFRLSRIASAVAVSSQPRLASTGGAGPAAIDEPMVTATVRVTPRRGAGLRRAQIGVVDGAPYDLDAEIFDVAFPHLDALLGAVLSAGPDARVVSPAETVALVRDRLALIVARHAMGTA